MLLVAELGNDEYFMPSLLPDLEPGEIRKKRAPVPTLDNTAPMTIHYVKTWLPVGLVPSLVAELQNNHGFESLIRGGNPVRMYHNCMQFKIPGGKPGSVVLIDSIAFLEIHVHASVEVATGLCPKIRAVILASLEKAHMSLHCGTAEVEEGFLCSGECGLETEHIATLDEKGQMWICSHNSELGKNLSEGHNVWFGTSDAQKIFHHTLQGYDDSDFLIYQDADLELEKVSDKELTVLERSGTNSAEFDIKQHSAQKSLMKSWTHVVDYELAAGDIDEVMDEVITIADSWQKMLIFLHLPSLVKSTIKATNPTDSSACLRTVIVLWLEREYDVEQCGPPSWRALVEAVADPAGGNDTHLAESIAEKYSDQTVQINQSTIGYPPQSSDLSVGLHMCSNFAKMFREVAEHLNRSVHVDHLKMFLSDICHPLIPEKNFISRSVYENKSTTEAVMHSLVPQYINYISFTLLEVIVDTYNNQEAKTALNVYIGNFGKYRLRELSPPCTDEEIDDFQGQKRLKVTVGDDIHNVSLDDVHRVTGDVEQATGISRSSQVFTASNDCT